MLLLVSYDSRLNLADFWQTDEQPHWKLRLCVFNHTTVALTAHFPVDLLKVKLLANVINILSCKIDIR